MKDFTDTNFLLSALVTRGLSAELFEILLTEAELVYSHQMQGELRDKLVNKFKLSNRMLSEVMSLLVTLTKIPNSDRVVYSLLDKNDETMLSSAIDAKCDFLITGDKDLLSMQKEVEAISNVSPREMWVLLNNFGLRQK